MPDGRGRCPHPARGGRRRRYGRGSVRRRRVDAPDDFAEASGVGGATFAPRTAVPYADRLRAPNRVGRAFDGDLRCGSIAGVCQGSLRRQSRESRGACTGDGSCCGRSLGRRVAGHAAFARFSAQGGAAENPSCRRRLRGQRLRPGHGRADCKARRRMVRIAVSHRVCRGYLCARRLRRAKGVDRRAPL